MPPSPIHQHLNSAPPRSRARAALTSTQASHESRHPAQCPFSSSPAVALTVKSRIPTDIISVAGFFWVAAKVSKIHLKDTETPAGGVDDMTKLSYLHEPGVLYNLTTRYEINEIYTYTGNIFIAVNPFQSLSHLYDASMMLLCFYEQQVLESNRVLEAFGNAKTVKNNNSSRFGKFVEIQFDNRARISGAAIRTYLLERSRVCQISDFERNYHCFYLFCAAPEKEREKYKLVDPQSYHYLNQSNCYELVDIDDAQFYLSTRRAMTVIGISEIEQEAIFRVVAAILHLGNIDFANGEDNDSSVIKDDQSLFHLQMAAELLMCNPRALDYFYVCMDAECWNSNLEEKNMVIT